VTAPAGEQVSAYEVAGGAPAMLALAHAWHERCLADPEAEHPFSHAGLHPQSAQRLAACWGEMLGGPDTYSSELGSVAHMVAIHSGNGPHPELDAATERCFALALDDAGIPGDERLRSTLVDWFAWSNRVVNHSYERRELVPDLTQPAAPVMGRPGRVATAYVPDRSSITLSRSRSLRFARRIAAATIGADSFAKPVGSPRLRSVIRVAPSSASSQV
jgi:hemoglobin